MSHFRGFYRDKRQVHFWGLNLGPSAHSSICVPYCPILPNILLLEKLDALVSEDAYGIMDRSRPSAHSVPEAIDRADGTMMGEPCARLCCAKWGPHPIALRLVSSWGTQNYELYSEGKIKWR